MTTRHRIGLIVPSSNTTMETEVPAMLSRVGRHEFTFHSSRARLREVSPEELTRMVGDGERCATEVSDAAVDVIAYACLVALMAQGPGYHVQAERRLEEAARANGHPAPVVTSAGALVEGARVLGARRIAVLAPYMKPVTQLVVEYITEAGIEVQDSRSLEVSNNLEVGRIDPMRLLDELQHLDTDGVDAVVLSACVQCPSLPAIQIAEDRLGVPVMSASVATTYCILDRLGIDPKLPGAGALLAGRAEAVA